MNTVRDEDRDIIVAYVVKGFWSAAASQEDLAYTDGELALTSNLIRYGDMCNDHWKDGVYAGIYAYGVAELFGEYLAETLAARKEFPSDEECAGHLEWLIDMDRAYVA